MWRKVLGWMMIGGIVMTMAACSSSRPRVVHAPPPPPPADGLSQCLESLDQRRIVYDRIADWRTPEGCGIEWAVRVRQSAIPWNRPAQMSCPMSAKIWDFETYVIQPAAQKYFNRSVRQISHFGTYNCRGERGGRPDRMSQHAFGRAIDIAGFDLDDGTRITVVRDWRNQGAKSQFLHEVAKGACGIFSVVLTPDSNAEHYNHMHVDIGPYKLCSP